MHFLVCLWLPIALYKLFYLFTYILCNSGSSKYFFIKSAMHGKVLDIEGGNPQAGAKVVMFDQKDRHDADNQLWFEDRYGNIRSKLNEHLILDASGELVSRIFTVQLFVIVILSVCLSVPSVTLVDCPHGSTYGHDFFTIW